MFRAHRAHHQERQIVSIQPLVAVTLCRWPCCAQVGSELLCASLWSFIKNYYIMHGQQIQKILIFIYPIYNHNWRNINTIYIKEKVSRDRPRWPKGFQVGWGPWFSWRFGTTRVVGRQPYAPAAFTPREIPGTHFQRLSRPQRTWFCRGNHEKNPQWQHRESIPGPPD